MIDSQAQVAASSGKYAGQVVYVFAYDVAYDTRRETIPQLLGQKVSQFSIVADKRVPRQVFFYRPQMISLPPQNRRGPHGPVPVAQTVKLFPVGAISITIRVPFCVNDLGELVEYHDLHLGDDGAGQAGETSIHDEALVLAKRVCQELAPHLIHPISPLRQDESYTVFCLNAPLGGAPAASAEDWFIRNRRAVAALLTQETDLEALSDQEAEESTNMFLSYYQQDLAVVDWDAAILIDQKGNFDETLHIIELANVQLAELEAYDNFLDGNVERSYRDMLGPKMHRSRDVLNELRELRVDMARLSDELDNSTKFFGDWHLARLYKNLSERFHLGDWRRAIDEKIDTLDDLYQILKQDINNRWMLILEIAVVVLFVIDLVILLVGLK